MEKSEKLTDKEIVKALEQWIKNYDGLCINFITLGNALDLINRLQAENERLKGCVKTENEVREIAKRTMEPLVREITRKQIDTAVKLAKAEAYKECIEKVKEILHNYFIELIDDDLDNLLKELVGDK